MEVIETKRRILRNFLDSDGSALFACRIGPEVKNRFRGKSDVLTKRESALPVRSEDPALYPEPSTAELFYLPGAGRSRRSVPPPSAEPKRHRILSAAQLHFPESDAETTLLVQCRAEMPRV
jgi:hypothetical protein